MTNYTPERSLDPESYTRVRIAHTCACCGGEIYSGEEYYEFDSSSAFTLEAFTLEPTCICRDCVRCARRVAE